MHICMSPNIHYHGFLVGMHEGGGPVYLAHGAEGIVQTGIVQREQVLPVNLAHKAAHQLVNRSIKTSESNNQQIHQYINHAIYQNSNYQQTTIHLLSLSPPPLCLSVCLSVCLSLSLSLSLSDSVQLNV